MKTKAEQYWEELIERHLPVAFLDYEILAQVNERFLNKEGIGRKEALIAAFLIGANSEESSQFLRLLGHAPLYVKKTGGCHLEVCAGTSNRQCNSYRKDLSTKCGSGGADQ